MNYAETEIVADAGVRLRIIADGMQALAAAHDHLGYRLWNGTHERDAWLRMARHVDEVRVRLCALPIESEGEAA